MADRYPLIVASGTIQELPIGDDINLFGSKVYADKVAIGTDSMSNTDVQLSVVSTGATLAALNVSAKDSGDAAIYLDAADGDLVGADYTVLYTQNNGGKFHINHWNCDVMTFVPGAPTQPDAGSGVAAWQNRWVGIGTTAPLGRFQVGAGISDTFIIRTGFSTLGIASVGIGYSGPDAALCVNGTIRSGNDYSNQSYVGFAEYNTTGRPGRMYSWMGGDGRSTGFLRFATNDTERIRITSAGNVGINTSIPTSTLQINGSLAKSSGTFNIQHPIDPSKRLVHSFIEGPRADLIYRGTVTLSAGSATINLDDAVGLIPGTWAALCREPQLFLQNNDDWTQVKGQVSAEGIITIAAKTSTSTSNIDWMVVAERQDESIKTTEWTDENGKPILEPNA